MSDENRISELINGPPPPEPPPAPSPPSSPSTPAPSPSPSPGGGSGTAEVVPEEICRLGQNLEAQVGPHFDQVTAKVQGVRGIGHGLYTQTCYEFAAAYTAAVEYMEEAMKTKREQLAGIHERLCHDATGWAMAEDKSTLKF
ncbi:MAG TPA: hypothetical protein VFU43_11025 [Streptosporangiaceae bacterium]|nr:hypothetical protein [Streptosporangiaceae bacterium]